jgi:hypothetical protein
MLTPADANVVDYVLDLPESAQRKLFLDLSVEDRLALGALLDERRENPHFKYRNQHLDFVKFGLGEGTWSGQNEILDAVDKYQKVVVIATHNIGKSHISSRVVLGTGCAWPVGLARITTTASNYRQVSNVLWPYIRRTHFQYSLPGEVAQSPQWKIGNELIADGFSAAASDETATQGMHANGEFLLVVDEAGGISDILGRAFNSLLTSDDSHALVIGNAPTDRENSWFETICKPDSGWHVITIDAYDTPNFPKPNGQKLTSPAEVREWEKRYAEDPTDPVCASMYESTDVCTTCPPTIERHNVAKHLTSVKWVEDIYNEFGPDSAYYIARVLARFPKNIASKTLPMSWLESAMVPIQIERDHWIATLTPKPIKLGVDIASGGGDELAIGWKMGRAAWVGATTAGDAISSPTVAAKFILAEIVKAEQYHEAHGITERVKVKYDAIGIGWAMGGILETFREMGRHNAVLIPVNVAEKAADVEAFGIQRNEMWWNLRQYIEPNMPIPGVFDMAGQQQYESYAQLFLSPKDLRQLNEPNFIMRGSKVLIEGKDAIRKRSNHSPDRAECILLAWYEPPNQPMERHADSLSGLEVTGENQWNFDTVQ